MSQHYRLLTFLLLSVSALAWFALWHWGRSPYVHFIHYAELPAICGVNGALFQGALFVAGWTVMTVAMMLPTSTPLITIFAKVARSRPEWQGLVLLLILGYLLTWIAVGILAYGATLLLRETFARSPWLMVNGWTLSAGVLLGAGAYQFSSLKYRCLDKCRSPFTFVMEHWTGTDHARQALWLGVRHGLFCVGCCWTLMMLMFPVGAGNLGWMLFLGVLMAVEKNVSWGRQLAKPSGAALLSVGLVLLIQGALGH
jgi:predicted metal-binding membrane protein